MIASETQREPVAAQSSDPIDRHALVVRHNPVLEAADPLSPLTVGNGEFAFTADITGLQTFPDYFARHNDMEPPGGATPLVTQSQWGWHSFPNTESYTIDAAMQMYDAHGRQVPYASQQFSPAGVWLRESPHKLNLAQIGFTLSGDDGSDVQLDDLSRIEQTLDLWTATLDSRFALDGNLVHVQTWVHPKYDQLAVRVDARSLEAEEIGLRIAFPYGKGEHSGDASDWQRPEAHTTREIRRSDGMIYWERILDSDRYYVQMAWSERGDIRQKGRHEYLLSIVDTSEPFEVTVAFADMPFMHDTPTVDEAELAARDHWFAFWSAGGAVDLSESTDPRAHELERRVVLSQYLMATQSAGSLPPQETGLTNNSWFGKFHLEMHWWHGVHLALWDRLPLFERSLWWYDHIMPAARHTASIQGYEGVRWPKMVDPDGRDSPSTIGVFLVWQQPHPIYFAELIYRERQDTATLEKFGDIVFETASFMATYPGWDEARGEFVLGPPLIPAQESHAPETTFNAGFELAYWKFGLETAQRWRERMGLDREPDWDHVLDHLSPLPMKDGLYVNTESAPDTFDDYGERVDHPTLLAPCGMLPCNYADPEIMRETLHAVMESWNWDETWGWDYPLIAMTAARVGEPEIAIDALLMDVQKNIYLPSGNNYQDTRLTLYLPGNGALLAGVAMMAAGWDGAPDVHAPGFPQDGSWVVRWEGLRQMP